MCSPIRRSRSRAGLVACCSALLLVLVTACGAEEAPAPAEQEVEPTEEAAPEEPAPTAPDEQDTAEEPAPVEDDEPAAEPAPQDPNVSLVATSVVDEVEVFADADGDSEVTHALAHPTDRGAPRVFLVEERRDGWLKVLLPVRPNGSTGWIREADVTLATNPYSVDVDLEAFELTIEREGEVVLEADIGYGAQDTPTPGGRYYLIELLQPPDPTGVYGTFAYGLSGFSDVHLDFAGGEGVIGIHGTNQPDSIGQTVSNGCIRVHNDVISEMATFLPLGTPVTIS